jgi:hypothetical protein
MVITYLERRWGGGGKNPNVEELRAALAELTTPDKEHPDCWLIDENNWTIIADESGKVVLENPEFDQEPCHISNLNTEAILNLWRHLQNGDLEAIRKMPWLQGYG